MEKYIWQNQHPELKHKSKHVIDIDYNVTSKISLELTRYVDIQCIDVCTQFVLFSSELSSVACTFIAILQSF